MSGMLRRLAIVLTLLASVLGFSSPSLADNPIERLLSPGPLSQAHAKFDDTCDNCHKPFSKEAQDTLCLDCHKAIRADIADHKGFHGRSRQMNGVTCRDCHTEHLGRDANIVPLDQMLFDHRETDFPLTDRHRQADCAGCHAAGRKWAEAPSACFDCHNNQQPHKGRLGVQCESCHVVSGWRDVVAFNHGKTKFPLHGKHTNVPCANCHLGEYYKNIGLGCNDCHAIQDVHRGRFGAMCSDCHNEDGWKKARFDHNTSTRFPLKGAHAKAECADCHGGALTSKISKVCETCHTTQDVHRGQLGKACETCHNDTAWDQDVLFDHGLTDYPLIGLHAVAACEACHETRAYKEAGSRCSDCHTGDDVHAGRFTVRCESCHSPNGWRRVAFDHGKQTKFALTGAHAKTGCYDCHRRKSVTDASLPSSCYACHAKQDVHRGAFGRDCADCHTTSTFKTAFIRQKKK